MNRELRTLAVISRYGMAFVGLAVALFGIIQGGVGAAQYYFKPDLGTGLEISNASAVKDAALHDMAVGAAAVVIGSLVGLIGLARARRAIRTLGRDQMQRAGAAPSRVEPTADKTIDLTDNATLEPMPAAVGEQLAPFAARVWQCKLGVDLQSHRLRTQGLGAESRIDAELYVLALRNLMQAVRAAQAQTRSVHIWEALIGFARTAGDPDEFLARLERAGAGSDDVTVDFEQEGTIIQLPPYTLTVEAFTRASHQLATTTIGDLSGVRARTVQTPRRPHRSAG